MTNPTSSMNVVSNINDNLKIQEAEQLNLSEKSSLGEKAGDSSLTHPSPQPDNDIVDNDLSERFCPKPFEFFELTPTGDILCCCEAWLPNKIGNLHDNDLNNVWNSEIAQDIRASILDGSFKYCKKNICPEIQNRRLPYKEEVSDPYLREIIEKGSTFLRKKPKTLNLAHDRSCNLACPSCRTEKIAIKGKEYDEKLQLQNRLLAGGLEDTELLIITGSGDPFASKLYRDLLTDLDANAYPKLKVNLMTNGQLFTPQAWDKWKKSQKAIKSAQISMDAASEETYRIVRRGGTFQNLLVNLEFVASLRRKGDLEWVRVDFVVQQANYKEMKAYVEIAKHFGFDRAGFSKILNWGTFGAEEFNLQTIHDPTHPEHTQFLEVLKDPIFDDSIVFLGNLTEFRMTAKQLSL